MPYRTRLSQMKAVKKRQEEAHAQEKQMLAFNQSLYGHNTIQARKQQMKTITAEINLLSTKWKEAKLMELQNEHELQQEQQKNQGSPREKYLRSVKQQHTRDKQKILDHINHLTKTLRRLKGEKNGNGNGKQE